MLIFDRFPTLAAAEAFAEYVGRVAPELETQVYESVRESDTAVVFPFELEPPIVHVDRAGAELERQLEDLVESFGGRFAGT